MPIPPNTRTTESDKIQGIMIIDIRLTYPEGGFKSSGKFSDTPEGIKLHVYCGCDRGGALHPLICQ